MYICILHTYIFDIYNICIFSFHMPHTYENKYIHKLIYASVCIYYMLYTCGSSKCASMLLNFTPKKKDVCQVWQSCFLEHIKPFPSCGRVDQLLILGMAIPPLMGNTYTWYINPYYKVDDHAYRGCLEVWYSSCGS